MRPLWHILFGHPVPKNPEMLPVLSRHEWRIWPCSCGILALRAWKKGAIRFTGNEHYFAQSRPLGRPDK